MNLNDKDRQRTKDNVVTVFICVTVAIIVAFIISIPVNRFNYSFNAKMAGANSEQIKEFLQYPNEDKDEILENTPSILHNDNMLKKLPTESDTPKLIIVYRFGCKDCEKAYPYIKQKINEIEDVEIKDNIYFVASRSKVGKQLLNKYYLKEVPASLYLLGADYELTYLYNSVVDTETINQVFHTYIENFKNPD